MEESGPQPRLLLEAQIEKLRLDACRAIIHEDAKTLKATAVALAECSAEAAGASHKAAHVAGTAWLFCQHYIGWKASGH